MYEIIISLWVLGAWSEAAQLGVNQNHFSWQDCFFIMIWPVTTLIIAFIVLFDKANFYIKFNNPWL